MSFISSSYSSAISPNTTLATNYHVNLFSYYSDLIVAFQYGKGLHKPGFDQVKTPWLSGSIGLSQGLSVLVHGFYKQIAWSFGVFTEFQKSPRKGIHLEVQFFLWFTTCLLTYSFRNCNLWPFNLLLECILCIFLCIRTQLAKGAIIIFCLPFN